MGARQASRRLNISHVRQVGTAAVNHNVSQRAIFVLFQFDPAPTSIGKCGEDARDPRRHGANTAHTNHRRPCGAPWTLARRTLVVEPEPSPLRSGQARQTMDVWRTA